MLYKESDWKFLNMNSPADLNSHYDSDGSVRLWEYDRCRDGHCLVSEFSLDARDAYFETQILSMDDGAAIGFYYGDGCYNRYLLAAAGNGKVELRIPSLVPQGDTFRFQGAKRHYAVAEKDVTVTPPFLLGIRSERILYKDSSADSRVFSLWLDGIRLLEWQEPQTDQNGNAPRIMVKAMNEGGAAPKAAASFGRYEAEGVSRGFPMEGRCVDQKGLPLEELCLHIRGYFNQWVKTDRTGHFLFPSVPAGSHTLVAGGPGRGFALARVEHRKGTRLTVELSFVQEEREPFPQTELVDDRMWMGLNGIWSFDFDRKRTGEREEWYVPGRHDFLRCIRVPYSWQSLAAFGEESFADDYALGQANPFASSPDETGGIGWYQRSFCVEEEYSCAELVLGAVSGMAKLWLEERLLGCTVDSYNRFAFPLGRLVPKREYRLTVMVKYPYGNDFCCMGKQGFWFTDSPGIWQNVWIKNRESLVVRDILLDSEQASAGAEKGRAAVLCDILPKEEAPLSGQGMERRMLCGGDGIYRLCLDYEAEEGARPEIRVDGIKTGIKRKFHATCGDGFYDKEDIYIYLKKGMHEILFEESNPLVIRNIRAGRIENEWRLCAEIDGHADAALPIRLNEELGRMEASFEFEIANPLLWSPEHPRQYSLSVTAHRGSESAGTYARKVGLRHMEAKEQEKLPCRGLALNGQRLYIRGVLDQGYNPWGIYTYRAVEKKIRGSMAFDIEAAKRCGYNLVRMHIKDNEPDWYRLCDEKGMLVWDELPVNFYGTYANKRWMALRERQQEQMLRKHNYHPCVVMYSAFNESWGITGAHEKSPWNDAAGQRAIKEAAAGYKAGNPGVLVIDNSGYGKTAATDIADFHVYPDGYQDGREFFSRLAKTCKSADCFNFYNRKNRELMQDAAVRELLQRNCSMDLAQTDFVGQEVQNGQPVIISEFVHTDGLEQMVRIFPEFSGYIRMNLASQENEDTGSLTALRHDRSLGLVDKDFMPLGYDGIHSEDFIYLDCPFLSKKKAGERVGIPVYASLWSRDADGENIEMRWSLASITQDGEYKKDFLTGRLPAALKKYAPEKIGRIAFGIPEGIKGAFLFAELLQEEKTLCKTFVQFEVFGKERKKGLFLNPAEPEVVESSGCFGRYDEDGRRLFWMYGKGAVRYRIKAEEPRGRKGTLVLELSSCECLEGTRETDATKYPARAEVWINGILAEELSIRDHPSDRLGLFSNSAASKGEISSYKQMGKYGYGYRFSIPLEEAMLSGPWPDQKIEIELRGLSGGLVLYGNRMGRYGCDPMIVWEQGKGIVS